jgi:spore germination protein
MRRVTRRLAVAALGFALAVVAAGCGSIRRSPAGNAFSGLKVLVFEAAESGTGVDRVDRVTAANKDMLSDLAPYWFHVTADGSIEGSPQSGIVDWARSNGVALAPLINNKNETSAFLTDAAARARAVNGIADLVTRNGFAGINIDFEPLPDSARAGMDAFIKALYGRLHGQGKIVEVSIIPAATLQQARRSAYDYRTIARYADALVLMTYDQHDDGSCPGPVAQLSWVKERLGVAMRAGAPRNKILLGIADYGYDWTGCPTHGPGVASGGAQTVGLNQVGNLPGSDKVVRDGEGDPHFTYTASGTQHVVWYEDQVSVVPKVKLAVADHLLGLALWRGGYETQAYWDAVRNNAGGVLKRTAPAR